MSTPTGLDTNVLVRYYVSDAVDAGTRAQREAARKLIDAGHPLAVCRTVILELEWVLRGYYKLSRADVLSVLRHLTSQPHIHIDAPKLVAQAIDNHAAGLDFADALHHASYADCSGVASFDDRGFVRRGAKLALQPRIRLPQ